MGQQTSHQIPDHDEGHATLLQYGNQLQFTLFPKLSTEIRLKIWRAYLYTSPRYVDVEVQYDAEYNQRIADLKAEFPQTLFVNRESRCETLKLFAFLFNYKGSGQPRQRCYIHQQEGEDEAETGCQDIPIWINTKRDILHLRLGGIFPGIIESGPIAYIVKYAPEIFQKLRTLEVRGFEGCHNADDTKVPFVLLDPLQCFLGLKYLKTILLFDRSFKFRTQAVWKSEVDRWLESPPGARFKKNGIQIMVRGEE